MIPPTRINKPYQIVVDTNVLVAGLRSNRGASYKLLTILNDARWQVNISTTLIFEYEEILKRSSLELGLSFSDIDAIIRGVVAFLINVKSFMYGDLPLPILMMIF